MKLTRAAICEKVTAMPDRAELDAEVVVWIFVQRPDGTYMACAPQGISWMEALAEVNGVRPLAKRLEA